MLLPFRCNDHIGRSDDKGSQKNLRVIEMICILVRMWVIHLSIHRTLH